MRHDVVIIGGGPVGLFQALALHQRGARPVVLERNARPHGGSRSIGIHPPSLEALERLGLVDRFLDEGVHVHRGRAMAGTELIGTIGFGGCPGPFPFVLTLPQDRTEAILAEALEERVPGALIRGAPAEALEQQSGCVRVVTAAGEHHAPWAIACDGRYSRTRQLLDIDFDAYRYEGGYAMQDRPDHTCFGEDATVYLCEDGLVESFPLPGGQRRWVARTDGASLDDVIAARTGFTLAPGPAPSRFRAERGLASRLVAGRVILAGDAAHVVSPIGGQGMNLGWLGAERIAEALEKVSQGDTSALVRDARVRRRMARAAARRAEANMWLGRPTGRQRLRSGLVRALIGRPFGDLLARAFTMRGLRWGI